MRNMVSTRWRRKKKRDRRTEARVESDGCQPSSRVARIRRVGAVSIEVWLQSSTKGQPEGPEGAEDDKGISVSEDPFTHSTKEHEDSAKEEV